MEKPLHVQLHTVLDALEDVKAEKNELLVEIRKKIEELKVLRDKRKEINENVASLKKERNERHTKIKKIAGKIKGFGNEEKTAEELAKDIEELDFNYQTIPVPFEKEKKLVKKIEELKLVLKSRQGYEGKIQSIETLREQAHEFHNKMLEAVKEGEAVHNQITDGSEEIKKRKATLDKKREKIGELLVTAKELRRQMAEERRTRMEERALMMAEEAKNSKQRFEEKVKQVKDGIDKRKKKVFNLKELQILATAGEKLPTEKEK